MGVHFSGLAGPGKKRGGHRGMPRSGCPSEVGRHMPVGTLTIFINNNVFLAPVIHKGLFQPGHDRRRGGHPADHTNPGPRDFSSFVSSILAVSSRLSASTTIHSYGVTDMLFCFEHAYENPQRA